VADLLTPGSTDAPQVIDCSDARELDLQLDLLPAGPAVFAVWAREGQPYVSRTNVLRRRLKRLLRERTGSRILNLRSVCQKVEFWPVSSKLEGTLVLYRVARAYLPDQYLDILHLHMPPYVKLVTSTDYPRTQVTTRIGGAPGRYFGPFRTRASAEQYEHELLDLFQIRRCQEDLVPSPDHPGCIYGEMNMCLRPCQQVVGISEYASEASRVEDFLANNGKTLLQSAESARERLSAELQFEEAARQHKRVEQIAHVIGLRDELTANVDVLSGVAVTPSSTAGAVELRFLLDGAWQAAQTFSVALDGHSTSMDRRLKNLMSALEPARVSLRDRQEHLAILARWFYSSWRDGEWIRFDSLDRVPFRKLVGAISRVADKAADKTKVQP
jgi:excinuclease ABC subunit C